MSDEGKRESNVLAFPSKRNSQTRPPTPKPLASKNPNLNVSEEIIELARLNRRLIDVTTHLGERITEQERRIQVLEKRLLQLAQMIHGV